MLENQLLSDRYQVKRLIGGGGMANVYLGFDTILEREVAIKALRMEYANDEEFISRFYREAQSATSLSHPNIVSIYDVGDENDIYYMVMEHIEGMTLKEYIQLNGPISVEESVFIMEQVAAAIEHAHANSLIHRDIKPQNILIDEHKDVKVTDFGIALALSATSLTQTNSVLGSVHYLSPEQARGGVATEKSDIYSLGIVLFELLTGRLPFSGESAVSIALKHLQHETPSIRRWHPEIPQSLENVVLKATTKDPLHRYADVLAFQTDLVTSLNHERINEEKFIQPEEPGEKTKQVPIITDDAQLSEKDETLQHTKSVTQGTKPVDTKSEKNEENSKKKVSKKKKWTLWLLSIFLLFLIGSAVALFLLPNLLQPDDIDMPDVVGESFEDGEEQLVELGFEVEREEVFTDEYEQDIIAETDPEAGASVKEGSTVTLYVSLGEETESFSDYTGQSYSQVERLLLQQGYQDVQRIDRYSDEPEGQIIAHSEPEAGEEVVPGETTAIFEVSIGKRTVELDDLEGMTESSAREYLSENDLVIDVSEEYSDSVDEGRVISQSPSADSEVEVGSVVNLTISLGEEEQPPVTENVTFTVPYTGDETAEDSDEEDEQETENTTQTPRQDVRIYISDMNHDLNELYETDTITEDTEFTIRLTIAPNTTATYKVERDDEVVIQKTISYDDVEGD
ncbi:serine/threonine protein kinase [Pelagirhabdus alkalitolerans]|uniref:Serine/threonine-protein kinase PrkC n=1 Tax=Pelagirhabdus alkalitolerans TaxID=1612202 RepID=A0A1G6H2I2_9BACI|nr:Stk1 family PASTA domain-containing Ser/Thr kinase [Pelagirhabdus alkalitolerans]SDB88105.1 serine/threonine protein kinase [Pelagirhabdus alkalitolerans]